MPHLQKQTYKQTYNKLFKQMGMQMYVWLTEFVTRKRRFGFGDAWNGVKLNAETIIKI